MKQGSYFSVIIPTYQEERSLHKTLDSINLASNGQKIETIVVDGGSRDRTLDIARAYTSNIHCLDRRGVGLARNHGAMNAQGDILVFLDSDTVVPDNFFEELHRIFQDPVICGANCNVMPAPASKPSLGERGFYSAWGRLRAGFYRLRPCGTGDNGIIVRKDTFKKAGGFNEGMHTMEDLDFVFRASCLGRFLFLRSITLTESMRRIRRTGLLKFSSQYLFNFFYYLLRRRPRIKSWDPVR